jgi:hypothetical protein
MQPLQIHRYVAAQLLWIWIRIGIGIQTADPDPDPGRIRICPIHLNQMYR